MCLVIYLVLKLPSGSSVLPSTVVVRHRASNPQTMVYANLQPPVDTALMSPPAWWALTSPSHLDTPTAIAINKFRAKAKGCSYFLLSDLTVTGNSYFRKRSALCCPDFPLAQVTSDNGPATRPGHCCHISVVLLRTKEIRLVTRRVVPVSNFWVQNYYYFSYYANPLAIKLLFYHHINAMYLLFTLHLLVSYFLLTYGKKEVRVT